MVEFGGCLYNETIRVVYGVIGFAGQETWGLKW